MDKGDKGDKREGDQQEEEPPKRGYPCPIPGCSSKCTSAKGLAVHLNSRKHISEDTMMPCSVCADNVDLSSKKGAKIHTSKPEGAHEAEPQAEGRASVPQTSCQKGY